MTIIKFNINNYVKVKLTPMGKEILKETYFENIAEDDNGWSRWQLWELMLIFGKHLHMGLDNPFEIEIKLLNN
jgi:hypothetical protein